MSKPTRDDLLGVIARLQDLIGSAASAYANDRASDRADRVGRPLKEAFALCLKARAADAPGAGSKSKFVGKESA